MILCTSFLDFMNHFFCSTDNETEQEDCETENNLTFENPINDNVSMGGEVSSSEGEDEATKGSSKTNEEKSQVHKKAANAIERDKAVRREASKLSSKEVALKSSEALATAIRDMSQASEQNRKDDLKLWFEHKRLESKNDREFMRVEMKERESQRKYELEMMGMKQPDNIASYGSLSEQNPCLISIVFLKSELFDFNSLPKK